MDDAQKIMWLKHYSIHKMHDRQELTVDPEAKIEDFLSYLAIQRKVAVSTQNQAIYALVFLSKQVLE